MYPGDDGVKEEQHQRKQEKLRQQQTADEGSASSLVPSAMVDLVEEQRPASDADMALPNVYTTDAWDTTFHHHFLGDNLFVMLDSGMFLDVQVPIPPPACACLFGRQGPGEAHVALLCVDRESKRRG
jgi:hypothetical protein